MALMCPKILHQDHPRDPPRWLKIKSSPDQRAGLSSDHIRLRSTRRRARRLSSSSHQLWERARRLSKKSVFARFREKSFLAAKSRPRGPKEGSRVERALQGTLGGARRAQGRPKRKPRGTKSERPRSASRGGKKRSKSGRKRPRAAQEQRRLPRGFQRQTARSRH